MSTINRILYGAIALAFVACNDGIDPITPVAPGEDTAAPTVNITYPLEGTKVLVKEDVAPITIKFESVDDIEIQKIDVMLDGQTINTYTSFLDYRRAVVSYTYETLNNGPHKLEVKTTDMSNKVASQVVNFEKFEPYKTKYDGEIFYMPFDAEYAVFLDLVSVKEATKVGNPGFADDAKSGQSYKGVAGDYLTFDAADIMNDEFSAAFWYKINAAPDRSGILTLSPPDPEAEKPNKRTSGFRLFREGSATKQTFSLNVGNGESDDWFNGGDAASIDPTVTKGWIHIAITISQSKAAVYINGNVVSSGNFNGVDWTDCTSLSIGSGAPNFVEWDHLSDLSLYDELRIFNKALTQAEVQALMQ
ncbi:LamG-like jellyroll fold domain-containing protein [Chryseolinea sp. T2]|uniref:LamG-like jellyroll fold domain-containing protein n=1 Tax=Chryseolinea sp. T2 TaxID=3129255 RepID=UPI003077BFA3